jgi:hypothetical protein
MCYTHVLSAVLVVVLFQAWPKAHTHKTSVKDGKCGDRCVGVGVRREGDVVAVRDYLPRARAGLRSLTVLRVAKLI